MNDGTWHFLSVTWSGVSHTLHVYVDAVLRYSTVLHPAVHTLSSTGMLAVGASIRGDCTSRTGIGNGGNGRHQLCGLVEATQFVGSLQGVRVWGTALTASQRVLEMQWPFAIEKPAALDELRLYWRFHNGGR